MSQQAPYAYITLAAAQQQLANRLYDPTSQFWTLPELQLYLVEALQTWNALTGYWREDFTFQSQQGITFYDLTTVANTLRPLTSTDASLYPLIQYHLLEPPTGVNPWAGVSAQFTAADLIAAVQRRRDEVLAIAGCTLTRRLVPAVAGRITLPDSVIDVRRMSYVPTPGIGGANSVLWPEDTWGEESFNRNYTILPAGTPGTPSTYLLSTQPPLSFDVDTPPSFAGSYALLTIEAGAALAPGAPQLLQVPDDFAHVIKWGALADLLSRESNAKDIPRAQYCEQRYRMGIKLLLDAPALLAMRIGNIVLPVDSVRSADSYQTTWETQANGQPNMAYHAGLNLLALSPPPNLTGGNPYSLTATVVENAPIPVAGGDFLQVGRDDLDTLIDYAQHLAAFKQGGAEFTRSLSLLERFMTQAGLYNSKLAELGEFTMMLFGRSQRELQMNPRTQPDTESATAGALNG